MNMIRGFATAFTISLLALITDTALANGRCVGDTVRVCIGRADESCTAIRGCYWTGSECYGQPLSCGDIDDDFSCRAQQGCEWQRDPVPTRLCMISIANQSPITINYSFRWDGQWIEHSLTSLHQRTYDTVSANPLGHIAYDSEFAAGSQLKEYKLACTATHNRFHFKSTATGIALYQGPGQAPRRMATVRACNNSGLGQAFVSLAYAENDPERVVQGWLTQGWWVVNDGACIDIQNIPNDSPVYGLAMSNPQNPSINTIWVPAGPTISGCINPKYPYLHSGVGGSMCLMAYDPLPPDSPPSIYTNFGKMAEAGTPIINLNLSAPITPVPPPSF